MKTAKQKATVVAATSPQTDKKADLPQERSKIQEEEYTPRID